MELSESNPRKGLSPTDAAAALKKFRDGPQEQPPQETPGPEAIEDTLNQPEVQEIEAEADTETETEEVEEEDQAEAEVDEEAEQSEDELYYEVDGKEISQTELRELIAAGMRNKDYTQKTQELSKTRTELATERQQFEVERAQVTEQLRAQQTQLQDSLAAFAIEQDPRPSPEGKSWEQHSKELAEWEEREARRQQAKQGYQALQAQQRQEVVNHELQQLLMKKPEWRDQDTWSQRMTEAQSVAAEYGVSADEFATWTDHRLFMALHDIHSMKQGMATQQAKEGAAAKKVVKATRKLAAGAKPEQKAGVTKQAQEAMARARKTGKPSDALAALKAKRKAAQG